MQTPAERFLRFRSRIRLMTGAFVLVFLVLAGRAVWLMAFPNERLERLARRQHRQVVTLYPQRGVIYDRNGAELARSVEMQSLFADPKLVEHPRETARILAQHLGLSEARLYSKLTQDLRFVWLKRRMAPRRAAEVLALHLPGIQTITETRRFYPNRELASAVLGFAGLDNVGLEGIERAYDEILNGKMVQYVRLRDAKGRNITPDGVFVRQNTDGCHLVLTLDRTLQYEAERALDEVYTKFNAKGGFLIVMDPATGEILAMANAPDYNPNAFGDYDSAQYRNRAVTDTYEPGSTQKAFLVAAALNEGIVRPDEEIDCEIGRYRIGRRTIHDTHEYGLLTVAEIVKLSSNIGAAKIGERMGRQRVHDYYRAFGFGARTGSGLPGEVSGILRAPGSWSRIGLANHAFGQGMSATGLQVVSAMAAIANGGVRMKPYIVKEVRDQQGRVIERNEPREVTRVISRETAAIITEMLVSVTEEGGTGTRARIPGYRVAGKTGTAQKVDPETRRYGRGMFTSSFVGFVPAEAPRLVIACVLDEPHGNGYYGGTVAAPAFARVAAAGMRLLGVAPTVPVALDEDGNGAGGRSVLVERVTGESVPGGDAWSEPATPVAVTPGETADSGSVFVLPDLSGLTVRAVLDVLADTGLDLIVQGSGVAMSQVPDPGVKVKSGEKVTVVFAPVVADNRVIRSARR